MSGQGAGEKGVTDRLTTGRDPQAGPRRGAPGIPGRPETARRKPAGRTGRLVSLEN